MNFGSTFQKLRQSRQISMDELAGPVISKSQISRFENNNTDVSFRKLRYLVESLNMTMDEFFNYCDDFEVSDSAQYLLQLEHHYGNGDIKALQDLYQEEKAQLEATNLSKLEQSKHKMSLIITKSFLNNFDPKTYTLSEEELAFITDYLFSVEFWGRYEIYLLSTISHLMLFNVLKVLTTEILDSKSYYRSSTENRRLVCRLGINTLIVSLSRRDLSQAKFFFQKLKPIILLEQDYLEKNAFLFCNGWIHVLSGDITTGQKMMKDSLKIFKTLDKDGYYKHFQVNYKLAMQAAKNSSR